MTEVREEQEDVERGNIGREEQIPTIEERNNREEGTTEERNNRGEEQQRGGTTERRNNRGEEQQRRGTALYSRGISVLRNSIVLYNIKTTM